ncbi:MAG: NADH-quinone oxidoreductase subunit N [Gemmatimonadetes bacterium]|nr:MAG: NADH-quinone oxidoreductase subunit N [Gemmatimonadota bacterium]
MLTFNLSIPSQLMAALLPDLILMGGAMLLLLFAVWRRESLAHQRLVGLLSIALSVVTLVAVVVTMYRRGTAPPGPIAVDNFRWMMDVIILLGTIGALALGIDDNDRVGTTTAETHVLILLASSGMMLLAAARDLMIVFLGVELMSISVYALAGLNRRSVRAAEGALKYFLLGAFSTAFLLYGIALVYGATGATGLAEIASRIDANDLASSPILLIGIAMLLVGFGFKVSTVPFHMWAPDVYDGSPNPITAYMAATVKTAAFAAFLRVWLEAFPAEFGSWHRAVAGLAIATMVIGNAIGLQQRNLKRLLAYSSIAHAGFILVAIAAGTSQGASAMLFYLLAYTLATFGAFAVIIVLSRGDVAATTDDLSGLWSVRPWLAIAMTVFMLALMGFPVFGGAGFLAKWFVLKAAIQAPQPQIALAVVLVLTTVISAGYYLYVVMVMFMRPRSESASTPMETPAWTQFVMVSCATAILVLGVMPEYSVRFANVGLPRMAYRRPPGDASPPPPFETTRVR